MMRKMKFFKKLGYEEKKSDENGFQNLDTDQEWSVFPKQERWTPKRRKRVGREGERRGPSALYGHWVAETKLNLRFVERRQTRALSLSQVSSKRSLAVLLFLRHLNPSTSPLPQTWFLVLIHVLCQSPFTQDCHVSLFLLFHFIIVSGVLFPPPCPLFPLFYYHLGPHCPKTKTLREVKKKWEERIERIQRIQWMCGVTRTKALDSHRYGHSSY